MWLRSSTNLSSPLSGASPAFARSAAARFMAQSIYDPCECDSVFQLRLRRVVDSPDIDGMFDLFLSATRAISIDELLFMIRIVPNIA
jgi:hypothetical protein